MATVTKSIGTSSRDYSTITLWEADLDDGGEYSASDDAVGECYNDSTFAEDVVIDGGSTIGLSSITLTAATGEEHDGTAGTGARLVPSANGQGFLISSTVSTITLSWLEWDGTDQFCRDDGAILVATGSTNTINVANMLVYDSESSGAGLAPNLYRHDSGNANVMNCIFYGGTYTGGSGAAPHAWARLNAGSSHTGQALNCTVHGCNNNGSGNGFGLSTLDTVGNEETVKNCIVTDIGGTTGGSTDCYQRSSPSNDTYDYNIASDTTASGANSHDSETASDLFVSVTDGSEDLHLKSGATNAIDGGEDLGTTPTGVNIDINGRDRDAQGDTWDIGAHEFVSGGGGDTFTPQVTLTGAGVRKVS